MACTALLLALSEWKAATRRKRKQGDRASEDAEKAAKTAFDRCFAINWHATLLLGAWRTAATLPENALAEGHKCVRIGRP